MNNRSEYNSNSFVQPTALTPAVAAVLAMMAFIIGVLLTMLIYPYLPKETGGSPSKEPQMISKPLNDDCDSNQNPSASAGGCKVSKVKVLHSAGYPLSDFGLYQAEETADNEGATENFKLNQFNFSRSRTTAPMTMMAGDVTVRASIRSANSASAATEHS
jgi:hypothetical protein